MRFTQSELVRYAINQARPVFESCIGETEINLFLAYINDYNKSRRPAGTRARAREYVCARAPLRGTAHTARLARTHRVLRRHEPTREEGRARRAR